jgi:hypothetical protein
MKETYLLLLNGEHEIINLKKVKNKSISYLEKADTNDYI